MPAARAACITATPCSRGIRSNVRQEPSAITDTSTPDPPSARRASNAMASGLPHDVALADGPGSSFRECAARQQILERHRREARLVAQERSVAVARFGEVDVPGGMNDDEATPLPPAAPMLEHRQHQRMVEPGL